jgi:hypothetical protein
MQQQEQQQQQQQQQKQNPLTRESYGNNFLAAPARSCRKKTVDRAVVVIDGMTKHIG